MQDERHNLTSELYKKFGMMFRILHRRDISQFKKDMESGQGRILHLLHIKGEISQRDLLKFLDISRQSLAESLAKLEKNGCIDRFQDPNDKRVLIVKLKEKEKKSVEKFQKEHFKKIDFFEGFTEEELQVFNGFVDKMIGNIKKIEPTSIEQIKKRKAFEKLIDEEKN